MARHDPYVRRILITIATFSLLCLPFVGLLPVVAERNLHTDTQGMAYGLLYAGFALGAALGAISVGTVFAGADRARIVRVGLACFAVALAGFASRRNVTLAYPVAFILGAAYFATVTGLSTSLQEHLRDSVRGRVMALYTMGFGGTVPIGLLIFGAVADRSSVTTVMVAGALVAIVLSVSTNLRGVAGHVSPTRS